MPKRIFDRATLTEFLDAFGKCIPLLAEEESLYRRLYTLFGTKLIYGAGLMPQGFLYDGDPPRRIPPAAPIVLFRCERRRWSAAAVFACSADNFDPTAESSISETYRAFGIQYCPIAATLINSPGYLETPAFKRAVKGAVYAPTEVPWLPPRAA
jgi:hypothetical protein